MAFNSIKVQKIVEYGFLTRDELKGNILVTMVCLLWQRLLL